MNFHDTHSNFYLSCALSVGLVILYNLKNCSKKNNSQLLYFLSLVIYIIRMCNILAYWADPYQDYFLYFTALLYSTQSIMILAAVVFINSRLSRGQDPKGNSNMKKDLAEFKEHLFRDKKTILLLVLWNIILYILLLFSQVFYNPYLTRFGFVFLVTSYWITAHHLNTMSFYPEIAEGVKKKLDIIVTCLTMLGFINLVSTLFEPLVMKYIMALQGSIYFFEIVAITYTSDLFKTDAKGDFIQFNQVQKV